MSSANSKSYLNRGRGTHHTSNLREPTSSDEINFGTRSPNEGKQDKYKRGLGLSQSPQTNAAVVSGGPPSPSQRLAIESEYSDDEFLESPSAAFSRSSTPEINIYDVVQPQLKRGRSPSP